MPEVITIDFRSNGQAVVRDVERIARGIDDVGDEAQEATRKVGRLGGAFQGFIGGLAAGAVTALTGALGNLARRGLDVLSQSVQSAGIQQIVEQRLAQALRNTGESADEALPRLKALASELQSVSNFGDEAILTAQALLLSFAETSGSKGAEMLTESMLDLAAGVAKSTGETIDLNSAANTLGKALVQGAGPLREYGISLSDAQTEAFNAAEGLERVSTLAGIIESNFGGLARATVDPLKQLENAASDVQEVFGQELRPQVIGLAEDLRDLANDPEFIEGVRRAGRSVAEAIRAGTDLLARAIKAYADYEAGIKGSIKALLAVVVAIRTFTTTVALANIATKAFNLTLKTTPLGLFASLLTGAVTVATLFRDRTRESTVELRDQAKAARDTAAALSELSASEVQTANQRARREGLELQRQLNQNLLEQAELQERINRLGSSGSGFQQAGLGRQLQTLTQQEEALKTAIQATGEVLQESRRLQQENAAATEDNTTATTNLTDADKDLGKALGDGNDAGDERKTLLEQLTEQAEALEVKIRDITNADTDALVQARLLVEARKEQLRVQQSLIDFDVRQIQAGGSFAVGGLQAIGPRGAEDERTDIDRELGVTGGDFAIEGSIFLTPDGTPLTEQARKELELLELTLLEAQARIQEAAVGIGLSLIDGLATGDFSGLGDNIKAALGKLAGDLSKLLFAHAAALVALRSKNPIVAFAAAVALRAIAALFNARVASGVGGSSATNRGILTPSGSRSAPTAVPQLSAGPSLSGFSPRVPVVLVARVEVENNFDERGIASRVSTEINRANERGTN